ncbi:hypothetical protein EV356DRAFT_510265 [Viridothelium virens]|uniref:C2H2-type domain-containing protein n=1 Tax=Viridothelium virens TaxID=1048519 RepID=A0A6A6GVS5_VIRVR|nr:hypothetical protein EV356DRAFT_510265 [Viridothelium virens]
MSNKRSRSRSTASTATSDEESSESDSQGVASSPAKYVQLGEEASNSKDANLISCQLPPHEPISFTSIGEFENHYQKEHTHRCLDCRRNLPSDHFLGLHIAENHDPLNEIRREKGEKTYRCFVEDCDRVCSAPHKRRLHLIDKHHFPRHYDFFIVNDGMDNRTTMLRSQTTPNVPSFKPGPKARPMLHQKVATADRSSNTGLRESTDIDEVTDSMRVLQFVPPSVRSARSKNAGNYTRKD